MVQAAGGGRVPFRGALGQRAGILTAWGEEGLLTPIDHLPRAGLQVAQSTIFENRPTPAGRVQTLHHHAPTLTPDLLPLSWRETPLVHFGPIVHEIDPALLDAFPNAFIGLTPQGWLRQWDKNGHITARPWAAPEILTKAHAIVLSIEDVSDEQQIREMAAMCPILIATEGPRGAQLFIQGHPTHIPTVPTPEVDATGAGDIFAATFFIHLHLTGDPFAAAHYATYLASRSVTRRGLLGIPTSSEIQSYLPTHPVAR
ncbi:MAG: ribokinase [Anaerolineales bacterium]|nr:ribokinase [Anaerolineales bacterium]